MLESSRADCARSYVHGTFRLTGEFVDLGLLGAIGSLGPAIVLAGVVPKKRLALFAGWYWTSKGAGEQGPLLERVEPGTAVCQISLLYIKSKQPEPARVDINV